MIDLKDLRENPDKYRKAAELKRMTVDIDAVLDVDARCLSAQQEFERLSRRAERGLQADRQAEGPRRQAGGDRQGGRAQDAGQRGRGTLESRQSADRAAAAARFRSRPTRKCPSARTTRRTSRSRSGARSGSSTSQPKDHVTLGAELGMIDVERGVKLAGTRNYFLTGAGALLHQAVLRLAWI